MISDSRVFTGYDAPLLDPLNEAISGAERIDIITSFTKVTGVNEILPGIRKAGLASDYSVDDVLFAYSKAYAVEMESGTVDCELPAKLEKLDSALGLNIFPILRS